MTPLLCLKHFTASLIDYLFAEEVGWILEVEFSSANAVAKRFTDQQVPCHVIGQSTGEGSEAKVSAHMIQFHYISGTS